MAERSQALHRAAALSDATTSSPVYTGGMDISPLVCVCVYTDVMDVYYNTVYTDVRYIYLVLQCVYTDIIVIWKCIVAIPGGRGVFF